MWLGRVPSFHHKVQNKVHETLDRERGVIIIVVGEMDLL